MNSCPLWAALWAGWCGLFCLSLTCQDMSVSAPLLNLSCDGNSAWLKLLPGRGLSKSSARHALPFLLGGELFWCRQGSLGLHWLHDVGTYSDNGCWSHLTNIKPFDALCSKTTLWCLSNGLKPYCASCFSLGLALSWVWLATQSLNSVQVPWDGVMDPCSLPVVSPCCLWCRLSTESFSPSCSQWQSPHTNLSSRIRAMFLKLTRKIKAFILWGEEEKNYFKRSNKPLK